MKNKIINFVINKPYHSLLLVLALTLPILAGLPKLEQKYGAKIWYSKNNKYVKKLAEFERTFGNDQNVGLAVYNEKGVFSKDMLKLIQELTDGLWLVSSVIRVDSLTNYNFTSGKGDEILVEPLVEDVDQLDEIGVEIIKERALTDKALPNYLVSPDGKIALLYGTLKPSFNQTSDNQTITTSARELVKKYQGKYGADIMVFGTAPVTDAYREVAQDDLKVLLPILILVIVGFLYYTFRSKEGVYIPFMIMATSTITSFGFMGTVGFSFNNLSSTVPGILIAICIADTVHVLATLYMRLNEEVPLKEALNKSFLKNLGPTFLTSISTAIGFGTLVASDIVPIKHLGLTAAFGTTYAWFLTIFLIPPLFKILPHHWVIPAGGFKFKKKQFLTQDRCERYVNWIFKFKWPIVITISLASITAGYISLQNRVNSDPLKYFSKKVKIKRDYDVIKKHMGGVVGPQIVVHSGEKDGVKDPEFLRKVDVFNDWIKKAIPTVATTVSVVDIVKKMNEVFMGEEGKNYIIPDSREKISQFLFLYSMSLPQGMSLTDRISVDYEQLRITVIWESFDTTSSLKYVKMIDDKAKELGLDGYVSGQMPLYQRLNGYIVDTFVRSMTMAILLVGLLMIFIFRSIKLGLLSMLPNIVPLTFGGALMTLTNNDIDMGAAINYSVCLGVVVDDTIHFLFDYNRNRREGNSIYTSLVNVFVNTGPALVLTTVILTVGFGLFITSKFIPNINFGLFCSLIFTMALVIDLVYLPALLMLPVKKEELNA